MAKEFSSLAAERLERAPCDRSSSRRAFAPSEFRAHAPNSWHMTGTSFVTAQRLALKGRLRRRSSHIHLSGVIRIARAPGELVDQGIMGSTGLDLHANLGDVRAEVQPSVCRVVESRT
jgi:hypothetical protein